MPAPPLDETGEGARQFWKLMRERAAASAAGGLSNIEWSEKNAAARRAFISHLSEYTQGKISRLDPTMLAYLLAGLKAVEAGEDAPLFTPQKRGRGQRKGSGKVPFSAVVAVRFVRFCRRHKNVIDVDGAPLKTVANLFGVSERHVEQNWLAKLDEKVTGDRDEPKAADVLSLADYYGDLVSVLETSAAVYKRDGGKSKGAFAARDGKRAVAK